MAFRAPDPDYFDRILEREARFADARSAKRAKVTKEFAAECGHSLTALSSSEGEATDNFLPPPPLAYQLGVQSLYAFSKWISAFSFRAPAPHSLWTQLCAHSWR